MLEIKDVENKIINADAIEILKQIPSESIDCVITSPPYFNTKKYSYFETYTKYLKWLEKVFKLVYKVLKSGRMCCVNISVIIEPRIDRQHESKRIALPFHFVNLMEKIGYKFLEDIIWEKPSGSAKNRNGGFFKHRQPIAYKPNITNEYIFVFQKPINTLIDDIISNINYDIKKKSLVKGNYEKTNIWKINPETKSKHPAPFPVEIPLKLIQYYSYINERILDVFSGSGTTAIAALKHNRRYVGIELSKQYYELSLARIEEETRQLKLF